MSKTIDDMAMQYLATLQGIALGTHHIVEVMNEAGYEIDIIMLVVVLRIMSSYRNMLMRLAV